MSQMEIDRVLTQIRELRQLVSAPTGSIGTAGGAGGAPDVTGPGSFASVLKQGLAQVSATQDRATDMATAFERGKPGVELPQVMLEMQKANIAFRATVEVRNKLVSAYQEIMNMPV